MSRVRQSITLTDPQVVYLRAEAERLGITVSDLVRRIIDDWREPRIVPKVGSESLNLPNWLNPLG